MDNGVVSLTHRNIGKIKFNNIGNRSFNIVAIVSLFIQTSIPIQLFIHKLKHQKKMDPAQKNPLREYFNRKFNKEGLFRLKYSFSNLCGV
jgi:hypothetical protein